MDPVVCKAGSYTWQIGYAGNDAPTTVFGQAPQSAIAVAKLDKAADFEAILKDALGEASMDKRAILLPVSTFMQPADRARMASIAFEGLDVQSLFLPHLPVCALYSAGATDGTVMMLGHDHCAAASIVNSAVVGHQIQEVGGRDVTARLQELLADNLPADAKTHDYGLRTKLPAAVHIKERYAAAMPTAGKDELTVEIDLPDDKTINVRVPQAARHGCVDVLFENDGLATVYAHAHAHLDADQVAAVRGKQIICGGTAMIDKIEERIAKEISLVGGGGPLVVEAAQERKYHEWIGASILGSLSSFANMAMTKQDFDESGVA